MTGDFIFGGLIFGAIAYAFGYFHGVWRGHQPIDEDDRAYDDGAWRD